MLLAREKKIVTLLIEHEDKLTTTQIATSLKVSSRTIKADIKKINEELEKHSCRINSQQGVGLWIEYDNHEAKKYLKEVTRDTADLYLSPEVRKYHLAVELLLQDDYTSMEVLAKEYYISKATVLNDLNELENWEKTEASTPQRWEQDVLEPVDLLILHRMRRRSYSLEHLLQAVQNMNSKMVS